MLVTLSSQKFQDHGEAPEKLYYNTHRSMTEDEEANWRAQSKNDPLIFRPFLKVFRSS